MTDRKLVAQQRELVQELRALVAHRADDEQRIAMASQQRTQSTASEHRQTVEEITTRFEQESRAVQEEYDQVRNDIVTQAEAEYEAAQKEFDDVLYRIRENHTQQTAEATQEHEESRWMVTSVYDEESEDSPKHRYEQFRSRTGNERDFLETQSGELANMLQDAQQVLEKRRQSCADALPQARLQAETLDELNEAHTALFEEAGQHLARLKGLWLPRQFGGIRPLLMVLFAWCLFIPFAVSLKVDPRRLIDDFSSVDQGWLGMASGIAAALALVIVTFVYLAARAQSFGVFHKLQQSIANAHAAHRKWLKMSKAELRRQREEAETWHKQLVAQKKAALQKSEAAHQRRLVEIDATRDNELEHANRRYPAELDRIVDQRDRRLQDVDQRYPSRLASLKHRFDSRSELLNRQQSESLQTLEAELQREWQWMSDNWLNGFAEISQATHAIGGVVGNQFPGWSQLAQQEWFPPEAAPEVIPAGTFDVSLDAMEGGLPNDSRLAVEPTRFAHPALLTFPDHASMTIRATGEGRTVAVSMFQSVMLRLLTSLPPGKIRFTIVDPVGLGENFSAFMHLADYDELMVNNRIWTESTQIERRLADLTEHMENVFQTYLRNEFATIEEYNQQAGEVAEPYHILVVANFPANFSEEAVRRLISIVNSGPRCGVHTLLSIDSKQQLPYGFDTADLESTGLNLVWKRGRFSWPDPVLADLPFHPEMPPPPGEFGEIVRAVGEKSRDARHVEVPFDRVAPNAKRLWNENTRAGINVPLGRAGATKLQHLRLGKGTSQHVLIAGKTGSGKSTFMHILITNLSLYYGPDEIEFYLVDFKKGVEFKTYATNRLPHARVIAIESDREFGLSVLEGLDELLKQRGDMFRDQGVQDLAAYRDQNPDAVLPRVLLVIDEFQEFFIDDDQLSQRASLLLDRLVRQGRAFGIHVLLGSQTLGGAYSLARSTLGQVAVRVALQCSDADAHLILSEDNMAARLLTRPGEAIYNDANGLVEGNHPFQIAWLGDERRDEWLARVRAKSDADGVEAPPAIVFEGNIPADPRRNPVFTTHAEPDDRTVSPRSVRLWIGEPVAIQDPTAASLRRQGGHNLLIAGQNEALARGIQYLCAVSLATQVTPGKADGALHQVYWFDPPDDADSGSFASARFVETLPLSHRMVEPRDVGDVITQVHDEMTRRDQGGLTTEMPIYLVIHNLSRFRDLRKDDDDFGFGGFDAEKPVTVNKRFAEILREGPALGIHAIIWCDTYNNATRWMSTQSLREFELRVVFQMNATDSSNLLDSPAASRLGVNRALLYREEIGSFEKFRPYAVPPLEWVDELMSRYGGGTSEATVDDIDSWTVV